MSTMSISSILQSLQKYQDQANAANQARYTQGLDTLTNGQFGVSTGYNQAEQGVGNVGQAAKQRIAQSLSSNVAGGQQNLTSRGLGNSTITDAVTRGYQRDAELANEQVDEQQAQLQAGLKTQGAQAGMNAANSVAQFIASKNELGPDTGLYAQLAQAAANRPSTVTPQPTVNPYMAPGARNSLSGGAGGGGGGGAPSMGNAQGGYQGSMGGGGGISQAVGGPLNYAGPNAAQGSNNAGDTSGPMGGMLPAGGANIFYGNGGAAGTPGTPGAAAANTGPISAAISGQPTQTSGVQPPMANQPQAAGPDMGVEVPTWDGSKWVTVKKYA